MQSDTQVNELARAVGQQVEKSYPFLWFISERQFKQCFAPRLLSLEAQLKNGDSLQMSVSPVKLNVNGRELNAPAGINYDIILDSQGRSKLVYRCSVYLVGSIQETGEEVLYFSTQKPQ